MVSGPKPDTPEWVVALASTLVQCIRNQVQRQDDDAVVDHAFAALSGDVRHAPPQPPESPMQNVSAVVRRLRLTQPRWERE